MADPANVRAKRTLADVVGVCRMPDARHCKIDRASPARQSCRAAVDALRSGGDCVGRKSDS